MSLRNIPNTDVIQQVKFAKQSNSITCSVVNQWYDIISLTLNRKKSGSDILIQASGTVHPQLVNGAWSVEIIANSTIVHTCRASGFPAVNIQGVSLIGVLTPTQDNSALLTVKIRAKTETSGSVLVVGHVGYNELFQLVAQEF